MPIIHVKTIAAHARCISLGASPFTREKGSGTLHITNLFHGYLGYLLTDSAKHEVCMKKQSPSLWLTLTSHLLATQNKPLM